MKALIKPENEAEAIALKAILMEHEIEATIVSFHDTAYDGLYQSQYGWGVIKVTEADYPKARKIVAEWKLSAPDDLAWQDEEYIIRAADRG